MDFKEALKNSCFSLALQSGTKEGIIEEMVDMLVRAGKIRNRKAALRAVLDREKKMSTGMQEGVAIPHGKTDSVDGLVAAFALKKEGLDFGSMDGKPSRIFVMTVSSVLEAGPHLQYLAEIGKLLSSPSIRRKILRANTIKEVTAALTA